ncbi:CHAT domain-containing protein [Streptomyces pini]|uniref:CHAT domain-containing protein n=1 Tax=Streptomyces pini TaxID=1520580 RepID=A0A1I3XQD2_9ACTN|nr:CHAT domain-containing protein [Streptomyces pini]SFK21693.1 CHAT domain-containing protein [Streptomyces pini]
MSDADAESPSARAATALARTADCAVPLPRTFRNTPYQGIRGTELDGEITGLESLLEQLPESGTTAARLRARLGTLRSVRFVLDGAAEDRNAAVPLLQEARGSERLCAEERTAASKSLMLLLASRVAPLGQAVSEAEALTVDLVRAVAGAGTPEERGGDGTLEDMRLLLRLGAEAGLLAEAPFRQEDILRLAGFLMDPGRVGDPGSMAEAAELVRRNAGLLPRPLRPLLDGALSMLGTFSNRPAEPGAPERAEIPSDEILQDALHLMAVVGVSDPGAVGSEELRKVIGRLDSGPEASPSSRMTAAMLHITEGMRTRDREAFRSSLRILRQLDEAGELREPADREWLQAVTAGNLEVAAATGGSLQDEEAAMALMESLLSRAAPDIPVPAELRAGAACLRIRNRLTAAQENGDVTAVDRLIEELLDLDHELPEPSVWGGALVPFMLGLAHLTRAFLTRDVRDVRKAGVHIEEALEAPVETPAIRDLLDSGWAAAFSLSGALESDPGRVAEGIRRTRSVLGRAGITFDFEARTRGLVASGLSLLHRLTGDVAALDEAVGEVREALAALPPGGTPVSASLYWDLASLHADRAAARPGTPEADEDLLAAVAAARDSLRATAADVLLQLGVRHGLRVARQGADHGRVAASWALRVGRTEEALACLEAGRSLVLGAAAESRGVADRLEALGAADLAAQWREAAPAPPPLRQEEAESPLKVLSALTGGTPGLPGDVRSRALELLRGQQGRTDEQSPSETVAGLRAGLARAGVDALVHLLPGTGAEDGALVVTTPAGPVRAVPLPALSQEGRGAVDAFVRAGTERQRLLDTPFDAVSPQERKRVAGRRRQAFEEVCRWAGEVLSPVLDALGLWERALAESGLGAEPGGGGTGPEAVRLVLVPCGDLGVVPWPAAVLRPPSGLAGPDTVRACEVAVVSHAASGREFLRSSARSRMSPKERPALVYHGDDRLAWAEDEIRLLHQFYYPRAERRLDEDDAAGPATPEAVLSLLGGRAEAPASMLHLSCHGIAGPDPTTSALKLAPAEEAGGTDRPLTLTTLLEAPHDGEAYRSRGPLVVCGACETDLTTRDHDEALTVTSVLVHRLAADAVGARWAVDDGESEILMLVLHDRITAGLAPPDALRAAQRWMLTEPGRRFCVRALEKVRPARWNRDFCDTDTWAAFVHHGNPAGGARP